jgi:hypothetical protein
LFIKPKLRSGGFNPLVQLVFWFLCSSFLVLMWIGSKPVEAPYEHIGRLFTFIYFFIYFLIYFSHQLWDL